MISTNNYSNKRLMPRINTNIQQQNSTSNIDTNMSSISHLPLSTGATVTANSDTSSSNSTNNNNILLMNLINKKSTNSSTTNCNNNTTKNICDNIALKQQNVQNSTTKTGTSRYY